MKYIRRLLCGLLAAALLLTLVPVFAPHAKAAGDKLIALTFDDGPGKDTKRLLDGLKKLGAKCTFFIVGSYAKLYPETVKQCYEDGHQVASHSYTHPFLSSLSDSGIQNQMRMTEDAVAEAIGSSRMTLMVRPPYGDYNARILNALGVPAFYWSDDSGDWWDGATANSVYNNTMKTAGDGDILLLHDSHSWSVTAALRVVESLQNQGYEFVTLSELFRRRGVKLQAGQIYSYLRQNGTNLPGISVPEISSEATKKGTMVTITADSGASIWYTLDGSIPNADAKKYTGPFYIQEDTKVTAVAGYDMNGSRSNRVEKTVKFTQFFKPPVISSEPAEEGTRVTITAENGAYIWYTLDGSIPNADAKKYSGPFYIQEDTEVTAVAGYKITNRCSDPAVKTVKFIPLCDPPVITLEDGKIVLTSEESVYYTLDGKTPTTGSKHYTAPFKASRGKTITAIAVPDTGDKAASLPSSAYYSKQGNLFYDILPWCWYTTAVDTAVTEGILSGTAPYTFEPFTETSRAMLVSVLYRLSGSPETEGTSGFRDVVKGSWYENAVIWAKQNNVASGFDDGKFHPDEPVTREQAAVFLKRYAEFCDYDTALFTGSLKGFKDAAKAAPYARDALAWANAAGILNGTDEGELLPQKTLSRAELAVILQSWSKKTPEWKKVHLSDEELLELSGAVLDCLKNEDYISITKYLNPDLGVTFSPYPAVEEDDRTVMRWELVYVSKQKTLSLWGHWDGSGEDIRMTFREYRDRFIWNADFSNPDRVTPNESTISGNCVDNLKEVYSDCLYVEYAIDSVNGWEDLTDWATLKLVFCRFEGEWYLTGVVHGEWTV